MNVADFNMHSTVIFQTVPPGLSKSIYEPYSLVNEIYRSGLVNNSWYQDGIYCVVLHPDGNWESGTIKIKIMVDYQTNSDSPSIPSDQEWSGEQPDLDPWPPSSISN